MPKAPLLFAMAAALTLGCATTRTTMPVADAALAFAVRTALVNDPAVGAMPVVVTVSDAVVTVEGRVPSETERQRIVELAGRVSGVRAVRDGLTIGDPTPAGGVLEPGRLSTLPGDPGSGLPRLFAVGGTFTMPVSRSETLDGLPALGPVFRFGRAAGWHPVVTVSRVRADLPATLGTDAFGELRMLVVGGGLGYGFGSNRWMLSVGASAAASFNHVRLDPGPRVPEDRALPVAASTSPALVAGSTVWYEATRRLSLGVTGEYVLTRPQATWLDGSRFVRRRLSADTIRIGVSAAWWLF